ncbi:MAG: hypothetical protein R3A80_11180 [Bdellovibrionota bacterium]
MRFSVEAFAPQYRNYDPELALNRQNSLDKLFKDLPSERVELFTSKCHLFLQDDPTANIIRRPSQSLRESICRDLVESGQLDSYSTTFRLTAFLISRGIRDRETIEELFDQRLLTYKEFESEQPKVERLISSAKKHYFEKRKEIPDNIKPELWDKLAAAWSSLSIKQRSALEIHIMSDDPVSLEKGAKRLKISKASFKERVQSGKKKIEKALSVLPPAAINSGKSEPRQKIKTFTKRKDAPSHKELNVWLDKFEPDLRYLDWHYIFKKPTKNLVD